MHAEGLLVKNSFLLCAIWQFVESIMYVCFILSRTVEGRSAELMGGTNI